ncbi:hypothetical protein [Nostoc sp. UIC 10630]|uniref:hypothetical protein n=1 Tax=Nostoc sp. UIC 10630 TaxID=2100146 RepID=UPI0013D2D091|nr:hypothetical protein [Nostoc sp. UIC 10630]NEU84386.1 hypothetical protein [Nostoc sp. UIC 10630]
MPSRYYRLNTDDLVFAQNLLDYRQRQREEGAIALHQLPQRLKNITPIRPRANLSLLVKLMVS